MVEVVLSKGRAVLIYDAPQHVNVKAVGSTTFLALTAADGVCKKYHTARDHAYAGNHNVWHRCRSTSDRRRFCDFFTLWGLAVFVGDFYFYGIDFKSWADHPFGEPRNIQL